jgi:hypothetical protein
MEKTKFTRKEVISKTILCPAVMNAEINEAIKNTIPGNVDMDIYIDFLTLCKNTCLNSYTHVYMYVDGLCYLKVINNYSNKDSNLSLYCYYINNNNKQTKSIHFRSMM